MERFENAPLQKTLERPTIKLRRSTLTNDDIEAKLMRQQEELQKQERADGPVNTGLNLDIGAETTPMSSAEFEAELSRARRAIKKSLD